MALSVLLLLTNGTFTFLSLRLGFPFYGYGYFLSALIGFGCSFMAVGRLSSHLPYHTFVTMNTSISRSCK